MINVYIFTTDQIQLVWGSSLILTSDHCPQGEDPHDQFVAMMKEKDQMKVVMFSAEMLVLPSQCLSVR